MKDENVQEDYKELICSQLMTALQKGAFPNTNTRNQECSAFVKEGKILIAWCGSDFHHMGPVKRICVFEHSVMTNFNCACPAIQRGQGSGFLSEGSSWLTACIGDKYQIRLTRSIFSSPIHMVRRNTFRKIAIFHGIFSQSNNVTCT